MRFKLGLIVNPVAGLGGSVALKGSDGMHQQALALGALPQANSRTKVALEVLLPYLNQIEILTVNDLMGEQLALELGFKTQVIHRYQGAHSQPDDTYHAAQKLKQQEVDLILFAGGDGTARNIHDAVGDTTPVLGIPAGCKIHSAVYAITPKAAGQVVELLVKHELVTIAEADVMDIDEVAFRQEVVRAKRYGEMLVPSELRYMQNVKNGGKESDELVLMDIAAYVIDEMDDNTLYIMGSGSTVAAVMAEMQLENTLLGVDVVLAHQLQASDVTATELLQLVKSHQEKNQPVKLVLTVIGGQGHIFGRGNQQLSPQLISTVGIENIIVIATKTKLKALNGRPLLCDTGDQQLDNELTGYIKVISGYNDHVMYAVGYEQEDK